MKLFLLNIVFILFALGCKSKVNHSHQHKERNLLFQSEIGNQKIRHQLLVFDLMTTEYYKKLLIEISNNKGTIFSDTLIIEMVNEPTIELCDINGDTTKDLLIEYLRPARGSNQVSMLYLINEKDLKLNKVSNSIYFPNLSYDEKLHYISSFRFYGGDAVQMDFLKIESDTLSSKYSITKEADIVYFKKLKDNNWIEIGEKIIDGDIIIPEIIALEPEIFIIEN
nr:hypothetical protein [uncultured Flavobacterium sp.]